MTEPTAAPLPLPERLNAEADAITCYASTTTEHPPNRTAILLREAAAALAHQTAPARDALVDHAEELEKWRDANPKWSDEFNAVLTEAAAALREAAGALAKRNDRIPLEPTEPMMYAGGRSLIDGQEDRTGLSWADEAALAWKAMFDAAPTGIPRADARRRLFEALGQWSVGICRPDAELAPPQYLLDAIAAMQEGHSNG
jgi:hypothetical protein